MIKKLFRLLWKTIKELTIETWKTIKGNFIETWYTFVFWKNYKLLMKQIKEEQNILCVTGLRKYR